MYLKVVFPSAAQQGSFYFRIFETMDILLQKKAENYHFRFWKSASDKLNKQRNN